MREPGTLPSAAKAVMERIRERRIVPTATTETIRFPVRFPKKPMNTNPNRGRRGMRASTFRIMASLPQRIGAVGIRGLAMAEEADDQPQSHRRFASRDGDDEQVERGGFHISVL